MSAEHQRRFKERHPERVAASDACYSRSEQGRLVHRRAQAAWRKRNYEWALFHNMILRRVRRAVERGEIVKMPCYCGSIEVQGHHWRGYAPEHELDVVWLCARHHAEAHRRLNQERAA